jgi:HD-GYP domain-containing protein (c-di-GMP phosphodiesterase class II)/Tfp pilus assembly protein PilZ
LSERIYNSRIIDTYLKCIKARYPHVDVSEILSHAGMEPYQVADQAFWFTQEQINCFYEKCVVATGNENIAREAGRYAASPGTLGTMRQYTLGLLSPATAFKLIQNVTRQFTRSADYTSQQIADNVVELTVTPKEGVREEEFQCKNRIGFFEAIVTIFNLSTPEIEHPECLFRGGSVCRYVIRWKPMASIPLRKVRDLFAVAAIVGNGIVLASSPLASLTYILPASVIGYLSIYVLLERVQRKELMHGLTHLWDSGEQLADQIDINYRISQLTREIGEVLSTKTTTEDVIASVIQIIERTLDFDRGMVLLADDDFQRLEIRGIYGYQREHLEKFKATSFNLNNPESRGPFVHSFWQKKTILVNDAQEILDDLTPKSRAFVRSLGIRSFIICPIVQEGKSIGVLAVDNRRTKKPLLQSDVNLLLGIAPVIAAGIHSAKFIEARQAQFDSTLHVLAESIDARDFLTAGHSEKVAEYAEAIAAELQLPQEFCKMLRTAALLHDYGKIAIPDAILKKQGPLSDEERAIINTHPVRTRQIIEKIAFQGIYREIPDIVLSHHERWDGTGYPNGRKGEEIPLGARIIAVADYFEAITAKRHYREPMPLEEALQILKDESGAHFDPPVVEAFQRYLSQTSFIAASDDLRERMHMPRIPRIEYRTQVSAKVGRRIFAGSTVDISCEGVFVATEDILDISQDTDVVITFALPYEDSLAQLRGRVVWVNRGEPRPAERFPKGFGVRFHTINRDIRRNLENYINVHVEKGRETLWIPRLDGAAVVGGESPEATVKAFARGRK